MQYYSSSNKVCLTYLYEVSLIEFKDNLQSEYISTFNLKYAELGGRHFIIEFLYNISLNEYFMIVLGGAAWDMIKSGVKEFILRPFIEMYNKLILKLGLQALFLAKHLLKDQRLKQ